MGMELGDFVRKTREVMCGNKKIKFAELTMSDWAQFRAWAQKRADEANQKKRDQILELAKQCGEIEPMELLKYIDKPLTENDIKEAMSTSDGIAYVLYRSLKYAYPEATIDDAKTIGSLNVFRELEELFGLKDIEPEDEIANPPANA